jgi:hypothetical protein
VRKLVARLRYILVIRDEIDNPRLRIDGISITERDYEKGLEISSEICDLMEELLTIGDRVVGQNFLKNDSSFEHDPEKVSELDIVKGADPSISEEEFERIEDIFTEVGELASEWLESIEPPS